MSLIEYIAALGIAAILVVMIVSAAQPILRKVRCGKCIANLRQIGTVILQFAGEHEGALPTPGNSSDPNIPQWPTAMKDYDIYLTNKVLLCPSDTDPLRFANGYSYAMNGNLSKGFDVTKKVYDPLRLVSVPNRSQIVLFADSIASKNGRSVNWNTVSLLHDGRFNAVFLDGHVATLRPEDAPAANWKPASQ